MLIHDLSLQSYHYKKKDMGYVKEKDMLKESMMKNKKKWTHMFQEKKKNKEEEKKKDSPCPKEMEKERWSMKRSSYTIHQKYPHIYTS
jgi:hypothetical protein